MKYTVEIEVEAPVSKVVELFDQPENMKQWMPVQRIELLEGKAGQVGAKSRLFMKNGDKELAIANYKKSLSINPDNKGAKEKLEELQTK